MKNYLVYDYNNQPPIEELEKIAQFLFIHLDEFGDTIEDIKKALRYSLSNELNAGGFIVEFIEDNLIKCCIVINKTGMSGYIPENILVYVATHKDCRGKGIGKATIEKALSLLNGDVALHVEAKNPAKYLYEKLGFTNPYLEMRLKR